MGVEDIRRQALNVYKMRLLGAEVVPVSDGQGTLADAVTAALRHWVERVEDTFLISGAELGKTAMREQLERELLEILRI